MTRTDQETLSGSLHYRLELQGELPSEWAAWFGARSIVTVAGRTQLELVVADQAALYGALRRVHDLHLQLLSLARIEPPVTHTSTAAQQPGPTTRGTP